MTSCSNISSELTFLRADIAALNNKFSSKSEIYRLRQQIKALEQKIAAIKPVDESAIIKKTEAGLIPKLPGLMLPIINLKINPIQATQAKQLADQKALLDRIFKAESAARTAGTAANAAQSTAAGANTKAGSALARVAGLALSIAGLIGVAATVKLLESRSNGIEKQVDSVAFDLSKALGFISQNRQKIDGNSLTIKKNKQRIADVNDAAYSAQKNATKAREVGENANKNATKARKIGENASQKSDQNFNLIKALQGGLASAIEKADKALKRVLIPGPPGKDGKDGKDGKNVSNSNQETLAYLKRIEKNLALIPGLITPITPNVNKTINNLPNSRGFKKSVQGSTCSALNSGCTNNLKNDIGKRINAGNNNLLNKINAGIGATNTALNNKQIGLLNTINIKLGAQIPGGIGGKLTKLVSWLQLDRALNLLTTAATIHNAAMLSNNIAGTLGQALGNVLSFIGIKDENGSPLNIGNIINGTVENLIKTVIGKANYTALTLEWKKANRIYQAGANIINSVRSMFDSVRNISEFIAENTGRIGNALKAVQVVRPDAFKWMPEQVDGRSLWAKRLENLSEAASGIEMITGEVLSITENVQEIQKQTEEFKKSIAESPVKPQTENTAIKTTADKNKKVSTFPNVAVITSDEDKEPDVDAVT